MSDMLHAMALNTVLAQMKQEGPGSEFSRQVFLDVLRLMPSAPNIPGLEVFTELGNKMVFSFIELVIIRDDGKFLMTRRVERDCYHGGWHVPGGARCPRAFLTANAQAIASRELGNCLVSSVSHLGHVDCEGCERMHHSADLYETTLIGEPKNCQWFSQMPDDTIPIHRAYWPFIHRAIARRISGAALTEAVR